MVNLHAVISPIQVTLVILDYLYLLVLIICLSPLIHMVGLKCCYAKFYANVCECDKANEQNATRYFSESAWFFKTLAQNGESELEKNTHLSRKVANMLLMFV